MENRLIYCIDNSEVEVLKITNNVASIAEKYNLQIGSKIEVLKNSFHDEFLEIVNGVEYYRVDYSNAQKIIVAAKKDQIFPLVIALANDIVEIVEMRAVGEIRRRLLDMGIVKGNELKVVRVAPLGDPVEIKMNGFNLSLRLKEAEQVFVKTKQLCIAKKNKSVFARLFGNKS